MVQIVADLWFKSHFGITGSITLHKMRVYASFFAMQAYASLEVILITVVLE